MSHETKEIKSSYSIFPPPPPPTVVTSSSLNPSDLFTRLFGTMLDSIPADANSPADVKVVGEVLGCLPQATPLLTVLQEKGCLKMVNRPEFHRVLYENIEHLKSKSINLPFVPFALQWMADHHFTFSKDIFRGIFHFANDKNQEQSIKQIIENFEQAASLLKTADLFGPDNFGKLLQLWHIPVTQILLKELAANKDWDIQQKQAIFTGFTECDRSGTNSKDQEDIAIAFPEIIKIMRQINLYSAKNITTLFGDKLEHITRITAVPTWLNWLIAENFFNGHPSDQELLVTLLENTSALYSSIYEIDRFKSAIARMKAHGLLQENNKYANLIAAINCIPPDREITAVDLDDSLDILLSDARYQKRQLSLAHEYGLEVTDPALAIKMANATQADFDCIMQYGSAYPLHIAAVLERLEKLEPPIYSFHPNSAFGKALAINPADADAILTLWLNTLCQPPFALMSIEQARAGITNPQPDLTPGSAPESVPCIWQKTLQEGYDYSDLCYLITTAIKVGFGAKKKGDKLVKLEEQDWQDRAHLFTFFVAISSTETDLGRTLSLVLGKQPGEKSLANFKGVLSLACYKNLLTAACHIAHEPISDIKAANLQTLFKSGESELAEGRLPSPSDAKERELKEGFYGYIAQAIGQVGPRGPFSRNSATRGAYTVQQILLDLESDPKTVTQLPPAKIPLQQLYRPPHPVITNDLREQYLDMWGLLGTAKKHSLASRVPTPIGQHIAGFLMEESASHFTWNFLTKRLRTLASTTTGDSKRIAASSTPETVTENPEAASDPINSPAYKKLGTGPR